MLKRRILFLHLYKINSPPYNITSFFVKSQSTGHAASSGDAVLEYVAPYQNETSSDQADDNYQNSVNEIDVVHCEDNAVDTFYL